MSYRLVHLSLEEDFQPIKLDDHECGVGVIVREGTTPLAFWMRTLPASGHVSIEELECEVLAQSKEALVEHRIRAELAQPLPPSPPLSLTIAVCTKDRTELLKACLDSLTALRAASTGRASPVDILVVDNAPSDTQTQDLTRTYPGIRYVQEPLPGLDFARNRALVEARGTFIAYVDDDVVIDADWLLGLVNAYENHPDAGAFTGLVLPYELSTMAQVYFEQRGGFGRGFKRIRYRGSRHPGRLLFPFSAGMFGTGANMVFRTSLARALGGFDEALDTGKPLPGGGDLDMFYRVLRVGATLVYEPTMVAFHRHRPGLDQLQRQYWTWGLGLMAFLDKTFREDPAARRRLFFVVIGCMSYNIHQLSLIARGRRNYPSTLVTSELVGGLVGMAGEYRRSRRRIARIKHRQKEAALAHADAVADMGSLVRPPNLPTPPGPTLTAGDIVHVDLSQPIHGLESSDPMRSVMMVLWWGPRPLGHALLHPSAKPITAPQLVDLAAETISKTVTTLLNSPEMDCPEVTATEASRSPMRRTLKALDKPLHTLGQRLQHERETSTEETLSAVVRTRGNPERLERCVAALRSSALPPVEILVIGPADALGKVQTLASQLKLRCVSPTASPGSSRNLALRTSKGSIVAFIDEAVQAHPEWSRRVLAAIGHPDTAAIIGLNLPDDLTEAQGWLELHGAFRLGYQAQRYDKSDAQRWHSNANPSWPVGSAWNLAVRSEAVVQAGFFDENLSGDGQALELWCRLLEAGACCRYDPSAVLHWSAVHDRSELWATMRSYMAGHVDALLAIHGGPSSTTALRRAIGGPALHLARRTARAAMYGLTPEFGVLVPLWQGYLMGLGQLANATQAADNLRQLLQRAQPTASKRSCEGAAMPAPKRAATQRLQVVDGQ